MGGAACSRGAQLAQRRKIQSCVAFFWTLPPFLPPLQLIEPVASSIRFQFRFTGNFSQIEPTLAPSDWELLEVCFCWLNSEFLQFYFVCHACALWNKVGVEISKNLNGSVSDDQGPTGRGFWLWDGTGRVLAKKLGYRDGSGRVLIKF